MGEGVSFSLGADIERIRWGIGQVEAVLNKNKDNQKLLPSLGVYLNICIHNDINRAAELVRPGVGTFAHFTGMPGANRDNINQADQTVFDALGKDYDKKRHGRGKASHAQKMPIEFIERFSLIGSAEKCIDRLLAIKKLGIERIFVIGPRPDHFGQKADEARARFAKEVIPALKD